MTHPRDEAPHVDELGEIQRAMEELHDLRATAPLSPIDEIRYDRLIDREIELLRDVDMERRWARLRAWLT